MKTLLTSTLLTFLTFNSYSQIAGRLPANQATPKDTTVSNFLFVDNSPTGMNRMWVAKMDSLKVKPFQMKWYKDTLTNRFIPYLKKVDTTSKWKPMSWNPTWSNVTSKPSFSVVATSGNYSDLSGTPNLSLYYLATNPNGYISGINSSNVTTALGYTPYNSTNPNGYISSYTETDPLFDSKFGSKTTANLTENTNLYYTNTRARNAISAGVGISYDNTTGVITNSNAAPTINSAVSRTLNSNYTVSTKQAFVSYSIALSVTNPLIAGNSSGVGLAVAIAITQIQTSQIVGYIPANALVRIRSTTTGTASVTFVSNSGQETY